MSISLPTALPGLSPGLIAGVVVGTIVGLVLIVGFFLLVFFCGITCSRYVDMFTKCVAVYVCMGQL